MWMRHATRVHCAEEVAVSVAVSVRTNESWHTYQCVTVLIWMSPVSDMNETWHTYNCIMSHTYDCVMLHTYNCVMSHTYNCVMSHTYNCVMSHTYDCVMSHIRNAPKTDSNESRERYTHVIPHIPMSHVIWMSHGTHMNESWHMSDMPREWYTYVIPHIPMSHVIYRSLLQNIVSFIGLFCKRDLLWEIHICHTAYTNESCHVSTYLPMSICVYLSNHTLMVLMSHTEYKNASCHIPTSLPTCLYVSTYLILS